MTLSCEPIVRIGTLAVAALLGGGLTLPACSSDSSSESESDANGECQLGDTVEEPATEDGVPACAANADATQTYACFPEPGGPQQGSWYQVDQGGGNVLYGKPGGEWLQAESAEKPEPNLVEQIGC